MEIIAVLGFAVIIIAVWFFYLIIIAVSFLEFLFDRLVDRFKSKENKHGHDNF